MHHKIKAALIPILANRVMQGETLHWESPEENRNINYSTASDECCGDWQAFDELLRTKQYGAAGILKAKANEDCLNWLIGNALEDYNNAPLGFGELAA
jgi:hypothetical protein